MHLALTVKGTEELSARAYHLDLKFRNILFLIQKGTPTIEWILQNSIFPREEVVDKLRALLKEQFVSLVGAGPSDAAAAIDVLAPAEPAAAAEAEAGPATLTRPAVRNAPASFPTLRSDASVSEARFVLCDFCLDHFGARAQAMTEAINAARDVAALQQILDRITQEFQKRFKERLPELAARVREINERGA
jgi:hypothetical protein